jgi:mRNA-degrading endonuclease RelE of RelBE toxin-antitoxin system
MRFDPRAEKFIEKLSGKDLGKALEYIDLFEEFGFNLEQRYLKKVLGPVWELRPGRVRLFVYVKSRIPVVVHATFKKSRRITNRDIKTIESRIKQYE